MPRRSIGAPLSVAIVLMLLLLLLAVGWQVMLWSGIRPSGAAFSTLDGLLFVLGTFSFLLVMVGLAWLCTWLLWEMRLNQRQRAFLDAVTHEMKTPLASFRLYLDTLGRHDPPPERRREFIEHMRQDLDRLDHTVDRVLAAARAEERGRSPLRERVDLEKLLDECIRDLRGRHTLPDDAVRLEAEGAIVVRGDSEELQLIFSNLLENAVKYSDEPVDVRVAMTPTRDGRVRVEIADRGIGIPHRELRKIFQRFYRVGRDVQRTAAGLGLGLFVVRSLVRRQGGKVVALSEGAGRGSRFVVTLRAVVPLA
ncbi:MAG: HAMP domain-containing histidine kinase [Deltaproteobacteria bacterium]|nr:HAMP domain-containing histidine kinase [Deltaproteobacteria bacterium]MBW2419362.1 HAMP domain-containing histidine kinase [Deltaproteobacteria bacterium]